MKTYQDFVAVGEDEKARMSFILGAINEYKADHSTRLAANANKYYHGENPTINKYEKIIYDMQGKPSLNRSAVKLFRPFSIGEALAGASFSSGRLVTRKYALVVKSL